MTPTMTTEQALYDAQEYIESLQLRFDGTTVVGDLIKALTREQLEHEYATILLRLNNILTSL